MKADLRAKVLPQRHLNGSEPSLLDGNASRFDAMMETVRGYNRAAQGGFYERNDAMSIVLIEFG